MPKLTQERIGELRGELMGLVAQAAAIDSGEVAEWIRILERQDAFGCFTDPTGWINTVNQREQSLKWLRAVQRFQKDILAVSAS